MTVRHCNKQLPLKLHNIPKFNIKTLFLDKRIFHQTSMLSVTLMAISQQTVSQKRQVTWTGSLVQLTPRQTILSDWLIEISLSQ